MAKHVNKTYGEALFDFAREEKKIHEIRVEAEMLLQIFRKSQELNKILSHPDVTKSEKIRLMENIFKGNCSDYLLRFLILIVEKERQDEMISIFDYFIEKAKEEEGIGTAYVVTAVKLTKSNQQTVEKRLLELTKYKKLEMHFLVDENLIGGIIIHIGDCVVDFSIRTKLDNLKKGLVNNPL